MARKISVLAMALSVSAGSLFAAEPQLLIRKKVQMMPNSSATMSLQRGLAQKNPVQLKTFDTPLEKEKFLEALDPEAYEVEENQIYQADDVIAKDQAASPATGDPLFASQWSIFPKADALDKTQSADISAYDAWKIVKDAPKVFVYVVDSGIDSRDPDLKGRVVAGFDALNPGTAPVDQNGHGTHCASVIGANGSNSYGIQGVVPGAIQLVDVRFLNAQNQGDTSNALKGLDFILQHYAEIKKADADAKCIVSNSWGGAYSKFLEEKMQSLSALGCFIVTSAGNHGKNNDETPYFPCNLKVPGNTCVGASRRSDYRASFSGYGPKTVHLLAPGERILGIVPGEMTGGTYKSSYQEKDGTSQAVPHVSGVAALVWAANPKLTALDVHNVIVSAVDLLPGAENEVLSGGRLNAYRSLLVATGQDPELADRIKGLQANSVDDGGCQLRPAAQASASFMLMLLGFSFLMLLISLRRSQSRA